MSRALPIQLRIDSRSGVPFYRQIIDQVLTSIASGVLLAGDQLPTVRQLAVDLSINPNTVVRAYRELEIRGILSTQQGSGTFIAKTAESKPDEAERRRRLEQIVLDLVSHAGGEGFSVAEIIQVLNESFLEKRN